MKRLLLIVGVLGATHALGAENSTSSSSSRVASSSTPAVPQTAAQTKAKSSPAISAILLLDKFLNELITEEMIKTIEQNKTQKKPSKRS